MGTTDLRLYTGVPLTRDNLNFLDGFADDTTKLALFEPYKVKQYTISPMRRSFANIVVDSPIDEIDNVNYMTFKNLDGHRYYCYVTNVVYESEGASRVSFEIDFMTSWINQKVLKDCMIEREHTPTDIPGDHLVDEGLATGEYTIRATDTFLDLNAQAIIVGSTYDPVLVADAIGEVYTGIFSGIKYFAFNRDGPGITALQLFIISIVGTTGKAEAIKSMFMIPKNLIPTFVDGDAIIAPNALTIDFNYVKNLSDIDGYTPKNQKLFAYPYNVLYVSNHNGGIAEYRYEYSNVSNMQFFATCNISPNPVVNLIPKNYKNAIVNFDEILRLADYAQCSWIQDSFQTYVAQTAITAPVNIATTAITGVLTGGASTALAVAGAVSAFAGGIKAFVQADQVKGAVAGGINTAVGIQTFGFYPKTIRAEHAKIIDDTLTKFGYKVNRIGIPNLNSRPKFNYIKTIECNIQGPIPSQDLQAIRDIFNFGVTFWHTTDVGNYNVVNSP